MSELSDIKESISDLKTMMVAHIAETRTYREEKDKVLNAITSSYWNKDGRPGIETQVDRLTEKDKNQTWLMRAIITAIAGLGIDRVWHFFKP